MNDTTITVLNTFSLLFLFITFLLIIELEKCKDQEHIKIIKTLVVISNLFGIISFVFTSLYCY